MFIYSSKLFNKKLFVESIILKIFRSKVNKEFDVNWRILSLFNRNKNNIHTQHFAQGKFQPISIVPSHSSTIFQLNQESLYRAYRNYIS